MSLLLRASADDQSAQQQAVVTLTLGIFFDATGNNALNARCSLETGGPAPEDSEALAAWRQAAKQTLGFRDSALGSHIGHYTNIHRLHSLYATDLAGGQSQQRLYIDGIGTEAGAADRALNMAFGTGSRGIVAKPHKAVAELV